MAERLKRGARTLKTPPSSGGGDPLSKSPEAVVLASKSKQDLWGRPTLPTFPFPFFKIFPARAAYHQSIGKGVKS